MPSMSQFDFCEPLINNVKQTVLEAAKRKNVAEEVAAAAVRFWPDDDDECYNIIYDIYSAYDDGRYNYKRAMKMVECAIFGAFLDNHQELSDITEDDLLEVYKEIKNDKLKKFVAADLGAQAASFNDKTKAETNTWKLKEDRYLTIAKDEEGKYSAKLTNTLWDREYSVDISINSFAPADESIDSFEKAYIAVQEALYSGEDEEKLDYMMALAYPRDYAPTIEGFVAEELHTIRYRYNSFSLDITSDSCLGDRYVYISSSWREDKKLLAVIDNDMYDYKGYTEEELQELLKEYIDTHKDEIRELTSSDDNDNYPLRIELDPDENKLVIS